MALYRLSLQVLSRSDGRSAVAAAAYRAGEQLRDERIGKSFDYRDKPGIAHREILAPEGAPDWVFDRSALWNAAEAKERASNARVARELQIALPVELTHEQQLALIRQFVREEIVAKGAAADVCIHREDEGNPHAHVLVTTRFVDAQGLGNKIRLLDREDLLLDWRRRWEEHANRALAQAGREERIDHRSYADLGVGDVLQPQPKLLRNLAETELDRRSLVPERAEDYHRIVRENGERLIARPEAALELLTSKRTTFTDRDLQRLAHRQSADSAQYFAVLAAIQRSTELVTLGEEKGVKRYTTRTVLLRERALLDDGLLLSRGAKHAVTRERVEQALSAHPALSSEQADAVRAITTGTDLCLVEGYAGAGKSTMLKVAREAWEAQGLTVVGGALAGKAAEGLTASSDIPARTLASWQWNWDKDQLALTKKHVLVIDEAGMVGTREMAAMLAHAQRAGAKVVLVGDARQLQAIEPGAPMRLLTQQHGATRLSEIWRQREAWQKQATKAFGDGKTHEALEAYLQHGRVLGYETTERARTALVQAWDARRREAPSETSILLAFTRKDVRALNDEARALRKAAGELGEDHWVETSRGALPFAQGERLYFLKNHRELGVTNGTLGRVLAVEGRDLVVQIDGPEERRIVVDTHAYQDLDHGYAATVHKGQGVTVDRAYALASRYFDASCSYVALSRHREDVQLFYGRDELGDEQQLLRRLSRERPSRMAHEYLEELADFGAVGREAVLLETTLSVEERFAALSRADREAELMALDQVAAARARSAAQCLAERPEVVAAAQKVREARKALTKVARARSQAPTNGWGHAAEVKRLEATLAEAQAGFDQAERALRAVREHPATREAAEREASTHNRRIGEARALAIRLREIARTEERKALLSRFVAAAASRTEQRSSSSSPVRTLRASDEAEPLLVLGRQPLEGEDVVLLRNARGERLVTTADVFGAGRELAVGERVRATGRPVAEAPSTSRRPYEPGHDR